MRSLRYDITLKDNILWFTQGKKVPKSRHFSGEYAIKMGKKNAGKLREIFLQDLV